MGGCVSSKWRLQGEIGDSHPKVFQVWNVDEDGNRLMKGRIEVNDVELVLHQKSKEPIRWPMRCLRRYGFDAELFSFESGRRCATGPGIYAFRCRRAETLFTLLQEHIQGSGENETSVSSSLQPTTVIAAANGGVLRSASTTLSEATSYIEPIQRHRTRSSVSRENFPSARLTTYSLPSCHLPNYPLETTTASSSSPAETSPRSPINLPSASASAFPEINEYENTQQLASFSDAAESDNKCMVDMRSLHSLTDLPKTSKRAVNGCSQRMIRGHSLDESGNYARLDDLLKQEHSAVKQHLYINVEPSENVTNYANVVTKQHSLESFPSISHSHLPHLYNTGSFTNNNENNNHINQLVRQVNYAVLDLNYRQQHQFQQQQHKQQTIEAKDLQTEEFRKGYATIDFNKTTALSSVVNSVPDEEDDSVRKTRHNSKIVIE